MSVVAVLVWGVRLVKRRGADESVRNVLAIEQALARGTKNPACMRPLDPASGSADVRRRIHLCAKRQLLVPPAEMV